MVDKVRSVLPCSIQVSPKVAVVLMVVMLTAIYCAAFYDFENEGFRRVFIYVYAFVSGAFIWPRLPIWLIPKEI